MSQSAPLPTTVAELQALVLEQQASIENMVREIAARDDEIERLKAQIDKLRRMYFGSKSEKLARQIDKLEAQLEDLTAGQGAAVISDSCITGTCSRESGTVMMTSPSETASLILRSRALGLPG